MAYEPSAWPRRAGPAEVPSVFPLPLSAFRLRIDGWRRPFGNQSGVTTVVRPLSSDGEPQVSFVSAICQALIGLTPEVCGRAPCEPCTHVHGREYPAALLSEAYVPLILFMNCADLSIDPTCNVIGRLVFDIFQPPELAGPLAARQLASGMGVEERVAVKREPFQIQTLDCRHCSPRSPRKGRPARGSQSHTRHLVPQPASALLAATNARHPEPTRRCNCSRRSQGSLRGGCARSGAESRSS